MRSHSEVARCHLEDHLCAARSLLHNRPAPEGATWHGRTRPHADRCSRDQQLELFRHRQRSSSPLGGLSRSPVIATIFFFPCTTDDHLSLHDNGGICSGRMIASVGDRDVYDGNFVLSKAGCNMGTSACENLRPPPPSGRGRAGADSVSAWPYVSPDSGALPRVQAADSSCRG